MITDALPWLVAMSVLILLSAFFSGSEAALFSLSRRGRRSLKRAGMGGRIASQLLERPDRLLSAILFWNLLINMTYFAIAAIVGARLEQNVAVAFTAISLLAIIFFSEMLPKSVAVLAPARLSVWVGPPLLWAVRLVGPVLPLVSVTNTAASRLIWPSFKPEPEIDLADIERAIELGTDDAALRERERTSLRGLVEMSETRIREIMQRRSKLWVCDDPSDRGLMADGIPSNGYLLVSDPSGETIHSAIGVRSLRPSQLDDLNSAAEPVIYVPWSALVSQVLDQLNDEDRSVAIVVNEFGEMVGAVSIDDIMRRVLLPPTIEELSPGHYRVDGTISVRSLSKRLHIEIEDEGLTTLAGFIQRHNERLPRVGDEAPLGNFKLTVSQQDEDVIWIDVLGEDETEDAP